MNYYLSVLKNYVVFSGRARRAEYWYFVLFNSIIVIFLGIISSVLLGDVGAVLVPLYSLAVVIPSLAVSVRRLHDIGKSAWWLLISFIPLIGTIWFLILTVTDGDPGENKYGPSPKNSVSPIQG